MCRAHRLKMIPRGRAERTSGKIKGAAQRQGTRHVSFLPQGTPSCTSVQFKPLSFQRVMKARRQVHKDAMNGFGGGNALFYEKSRPGYPAQALRAIEDAIRRSGSNDGDFLVDLGCGTGKFTREILPFARAEGLRVMGVEPVEAMRAQFETALPGIPVVEGVGEALPVSDSSARALIAAQSFHWMSSPATLREVHRVLVPGGLFVLLWNTRDYSEPWVRALEEIIDPFYGDDVPRQQGGAWRQSFREMRLKPPSDGDGDVGNEGPLRQSFFGELTEQHFKHSQVLTLDELDKRMRSISVIATRPEPERADASRRARELVETHPDTRQGFLEHGTVELFYDTEVYWCNNLGVVPQ